MIKTLVISFPPLDTRRPPIGSAIVANIFHSQGHNVSTVDLQFELNQWMIAKNISEHYFSDVFFESGASFNSDQISVLEEFIKSEIDRLKVSEFDYIACSFFSYLAQKFGKLFLKQLRKHTTAKVIIGGSGLISFETSLNNPGSIPFPAELKEQGIIDEYISGEAEVALVEYLNKGHGPGIGNNNFVQIENLDSCLWPNYTFYDLKNYSANDLTIIGSRGCVRNCTFCDVAKTSPKYRYRSGDNIAREIIHHYDTHGITDFYFADSLVNGSFKAFNDMCNGLSNHNFSKPISWVGQYIIRSKQTTPKNHFEMLKKSGCETLFVGIESGHDRVRATLGKKFTNDDIEYYLENFSKHGIKILFLMFTGYVDETKEEFEESLGMFKRWQRFVADGTIEGIETLNILSILPGTPLEQYAKDHNFLLLKDESNELNLKWWLNPAMPDFDFKERVRRHVRMMEEAMKYKWPLWNGNLSMMLYEDRLNKFLKSSKKYIPINAI